MNCKKGRCRLRAACCDWQANIRANGWLETSKSYRKFFDWIAKKNPNLVTP